MDGTNTSRLLSGNMTSPLSITIDYNTGTLYWADYSLQKIEKSSVDGSNRTIVISVDVGLPLDLIFHDNKLFWASSNMVKSVSTVFVNSSETLISLSGTIQRVQIISSDHQSNSG